MMATKRDAVYRELEDDPCYYAELAREPGPEPGNYRVRASFRAWAKAKYASLPEANAVWGTRYGDWSEVRPPHLPEKPLYEENYVEKKKLRDWARANRRNMYYDWLCFATDEIMAAFAGEVADVRRATPGIRLSLDVRGHMSPTDGYMLYDPVRVDRLVDYFEIHDGYRALYYAGGTYDEKALRTMMAFPVFKHNYFRSNTVHPIWNAEDIPGRVACASSDPDAMRRNDLAGLMDRAWRFAKDPDGAGVAARWFADPDAVAWDPIQVPGAWDMLPKYRKYSGVAWYRCSFTIPAVYKNDFDDGSRRFFFAGAGMAQKGEVWLNGRFVGAVKGWATPFQLDVSDVLDYGGRNELVIRVDGDGGFMNGLRGHYHILPGDLLGASRPFGAAQYKAMFWGYLMRGVSAVSLWNWTDDPFRPGLPELNAKLNEVAAFALPALRRPQRSRVAFLEFGEGRWRKVDDKPYGGGPGMLMKCKPWFEAVESVTGLSAMEDPSWKAAHPELRIVMTSPAGKTFTQCDAERFAALASSPSPLASTSTSTSNLNLLPHLVFLCGHYEGFDARIETLATDLYSVGDFVMTGGELAAAAMVDATVRLLPGVLGGGPAATSSESFGAEGLLEAPQYTHPPEFRGLKVPDVLLSGDHAKIETWNRAAARARTEALRPDLACRRIRFT